MIGLIAFNIDRTKVWFADERGNNEAGADDAEDDEREEERDDIVLKRKLASDCKTSFPFAIIITIR